MSERIVGSEDWGTMSRGLTTGDHEIRRQHLGKLPDNLQVLPMPDVIVSMFGNPTAAFILFRVLSFW